jgi:hypothetical protein
MKRLFVVAILASACLLSAPAVQAQKVPIYTPNEISLSYGASAMSVATGIVVRYANLIGDFADFTEISTGDHIRANSGGTGGFVNLGYAYQINKTWHFGITGGYYRMKLGLEDNTGKVDPLTVNLFTVMNTARVNWFRTGDIFGMYSKGCIGMMITNYALMPDTPDERTGTKVFPAAHVSAVGLEVGRGFRGFMELGVGLQGFLQMGVKAVF